MVETQQHQEPIRHAQDAAEKAILIADKAKHGLHAAIIQADPQSIHAAQDAIRQALNQVLDARTQLETYNNASYGQQIKQTLQQLDQSQQELQDDTNQFQFPKQIR